MMAFPIDREGEEEEVEASRDKQVSGPDLPDCPSIPEVRRPANGVTCTGKGIACARGTKALATCNLDASGGERWHVPYSSWHTQYPLACDTLYWLPRFRHLKNVKPVLMFNETVCS